MSGRNSILSSRSHDGLAADQIMEHESCPDECTVLSSWYDEAGRPWAVLEVPGARRRIVYVDLDERFYQEPE